MAKKQDIQKMLEELERIYAVLSEMSRRHGAEFNAIAREIVATFKKIRDDHPEAVDDPSTLPQSKRDPLFNDACKLVREAGKASASFLQRELDIDYERATKLLGLMQEARVIGPAIGAQPREVYPEKLPPKVEKVLKKIESQFKKQKRIES